MKTLSDWLGGGLAKVCTECRPELFDAQFVSDLVIALGFLGVLVGFLWFLRRRPDLREGNRRLASLLVAFLVVAALAHIVDVVAIWYPLYGVQVVTKVATAIIFGATVVAAWPLLPRLAQAPSAQQIYEAHDRLRQEAAAHEATLRELDASRRDLEERVAERTLELSLVTARFRTALRGSKVHVFSQDRELRYTALSDPMFGRPVNEVVGRTDDEIIPADSRAQVIALKRSVLESGAASDAEISIPDGDRLKWYDFHIEPLKGAGGSIVGLTCAVVDITERKEGEAHLRMLLRELTHRSKNLLAVIQAMARQTARHSGSTEAFLDQFSARLQALATSHDLLIQESWYGVSLSELVRSQLGHYLDRSESQVSIDGDRVILKPEVAQNLGLALHELATNAAKYGALSVPGGRISIRWFRVAAAKGSGIEIVWAESGGPLVSPPERRGFGTLVIERNLARSLEAEVDLAFAPEGTYCRIIVPENQLLAAR